MKWIRKLLTLAVVSPLLLVSVATAIEREDTTTNTTPDEAQTSTETAENSEPIKDLQQRLEERKQARTERLTAAQEQRIKVRCVAAQARLGAASVKVASVKEQRTQVYTNLLQQVGTIYQKLQAVNRANDFEAAKNGITEKIEVFNMNLQKYEQALADAQEVACTSDPEAFQASLEDARISRQEVISSSAEVRQYAATTLRASLQEIKPSN